MLRLNTTGQLQGFRLILDRRDSERLDFIGVLFSYSLCVRQVRERVPIETKPKVSFLSPSQEWGQTIN